MNAVDEEAWREWLSHPGSKAFLGTLEDRKRGWEVEMRGAVRAGDADKARVCVGGYDAIDLLLKELRAPR